MHLTVLTPLARSSAEFQGADRSLPNMKPKGSGVGPSPQPEGLLLPTVFRWRSDSAGARALLTGVLALVAATALAFCGLTLDDVVYQPMRELPGKWVDRHFQSEPFWIAWRASSYVISVELPDTIVPTEDRPVESLDQHYIKRCGQPFPDGVTWSVRHFGRLIAQHSAQIVQWCEDPSLGHALRAEIGTFRTSPGIGYSIQIQAPRWAQADSPSRLPFRLTMGSQSGAGSRFGLPAVISLYLLVSLGIFCVALGGVLAMMERLHVMERLERHLQSRRDSDPD